MSSHSVTGFSRSDDPDGPPKPSGIYKMLRDGLHLFIQYPDRNEVSDTLISGPFETVGKASEADGTSHSLVIRWLDDRKITHERVIPLSQFVNDGREIVPDLLDEGLWIDPKMAKSFVAYLWQRVKSVPKVDLAKRTGWYGDSCFVLPDGCIGTNARPVIYESSSDAVNRFQTAGTLQDWRELVSKPLVGNSRLVLAVCLAFASVLLRLLQAEGIGAHFQGLSSCGKTTALHIAGSVCGGGPPQGFIRSWRSTLNGLEGVAAAHNDYLLALDEISQCDTKMTVDAVYMLLNNQEKNRANVDGSARPGRSWTIALLSSGEESLAEHAKARTKGGAEIRLLNIDADAEAGLGIFEDLHGTVNDHGKPSPKLFAVRLRDASRRYYGTAIREYLRKICPLDVGMRLDLIRDLQTEFLKSCPLNNAAPEVGRAANSFSIMAAAGALATEFGITGWPDDEAFKQVSRCFQDWLKGRGGQGAVHDEEQAIATVRLYIEQYGESRFQLAGGRVSTVASALDAGVATRPAPSVRAGFKRQIDGQTEFLFFPETFKTEVCAGFNVRTVLNALLDRHFLRRQDDNWTIKPRIPSEGGKHIRLYCVLGSILGGDE